MNGVGRVKKGQREANKQWKGKNGGCVTILRGLRERSWLSRDSNLGLTSKPCDSKKKKKKNTGN